MEAAASFNAGVVVHLLLSVGAATAFLNAGVLNETASQAPASANASQLPARPARDASRLLPLVRMQRLRGQTKAACAPERRLAVEKLGETAILESALVIGGFPGSGTRAAAQAIAELGFLIDGMGAMRDSRIGITQAVPSIAKLLKTLPGGRFHALAPVPVKRVDGGGAPNGSAPNGSARFYGMSEWPDRALRVAARLAAGSAQPHERAGDGTALRALMRDSLHELRRSIRCSFGCEEPCANWQHYANACLFAFVPHGKPGVARARADGDVSIKTAREVRYRLSSLCGMMRSQNVTCENRAPVMRRVACAPCAGWAFKHPELFLFFPLVHALLPAASFVLVVRDGRDVASNPLGHRLLSRLSQLIPPLPSPAHRATPTVSPRGGGAVLQPRVGAETVEQLHEQRERNPCATCLKRDRDCERRHAAVEEQLSREGLPAPTLGRLDPTRPLICTLLLWAERSLAALDDARDTERRIFIWRSEDAFDRPDEIATALAVFLRAAPVVAQWRAHPALAAGDALSADMVERALRRVTQTSMGSNTERAEDAARAPLRTPAVSRGQREHRLATKYGKWRLAPHCDAAFGQLEARLPVVHARVVVALRRFAYSPKMECAPGNATQVRTRQLSVRS
ncbi:hypothetical protein KFE25_013628 [Diacronema lutheri]|uniref:Protein-tyrosine sulfotransferase n=2 Tax=Diacronema lutheri TaxID=2081491 RepID=A0A8J6CG01_DIALT|nr:hypothetical protein KFE25_013628 [Diacronema lutheri]